MKKLIALLLVLVMAFSVATVFAGCEDNNKKNSNSEDKDDEDDEVDEKKDDETTAPEGDGNETTAPEGDEPEETEPEETEPEKTEPEETEPEIDPEELEALKEEDYLAMLQLLIDAETVNSKISDAVNAFNNGTADVADTIETIESLQSEFAVVQSSFDAVEWKTAEYIEQAAILEVGLDGLEEFFVLVIAGLEIEDWDQTNNAFASRQIYYDNSEEVYNWFQTQSVSY